MTRRTVTKSSAVPILMYHQVTPRPAPTFRKYAVTRRAFAAQMALLGRVGYRTITIGTLVAVRQGGGRLPRRPVIITFDDGFRDCVDYAVPILKAHGFTATFYLVAGLVGSTSRWLLTERGLELPLFDWDAARELERQGFECGAHSLSHPRLASLPLDACRHELAESRRTLTRELGREVRHLAYPFGSYDETVCAIAREEGYTSACSVRPGLSDVNDDLFALHRVPVRGHDSLLDFACRVRTARSCSEMVGQVVRSAWRGLRGRGRSLDARR